MQSFYYDHDNRDIPLTNPILVVAFSTAVFIFGYRAYFVEEFQDNLLFLMFLVSMLAFWRCLTIKKLDEIRKDGTSIYKIRLQGIVVLALLIILSLMRLASLILLNLYQARGESEANSTFKALNYMLNSYRPKKDLTRERTKWAIADFCLLLLITLVKSQSTLTFTEKYRPFIRNYYKRLNYAFTMICYPFLGYEALSNPLYIFIIYLVLKNKISAAGQDSWTNTNNLIGILRYLILMMMIFSSLTAQSIYQWLGSEDHRLADNLNNSFYMDVLFFLTCHLCVYFGTIYKSIDKKEESGTRNCVYPSACDFSETYFDKYFLTKWMPIMTSSHFVYSTNYYATNISTVRKAFEKDPLITEHIRKLKIKQETHKYKWVKRLFIKILKTILNMLINNFDFIFMILAYVSLVRVSIQNYGILTMELFDLSMLIWAFLSLTVTSSQHLLLRDFSINFLFPIFIFSVILTRILMSAFEIKHFQSLKGYFFPDIEKAEENELKAYFQDHLIVFIPIFLYSVAQTIRNKQAKQFTTGFFNTFGLENLETNKGQIGYLTLALKLLGLVVISTSRYIALVIGVFTSLVTISLPNTFLLFFSLLLLGISKYDKYVWKIYMYYSICILMLMYVNNKIPYSIESFNIEVLCLMGLTKNEKICKFL